MRQRSLGSEVAVRLLEAGGTVSDHIQDSSSGAPAPTPKEQLDHFIYPWAAAPDIIRANQKDAYFQSVLLTHLSSVVRSLYGARTAHNWTSEARTFTELLYLSLTTLVGNRTLGEEYCDIVQVEDDTMRLPSLTRRGVYILANVLLPYALHRFLPALRRRVRSKLEKTLRRSHVRRASSPSRAAAPQTRKHHLQEYLLRHLDTITSPAPVYAVSLTIFYFSGAYYQLSKRVARLRYVFTRQLAEDGSDQRVGYEVLGVLLLLQLAVQAYLHVQSTRADVQMANVPANASAAAGASAVTDGASSDAGGAGGFAAPLLFETPHAADPAARRERLARLTHTPPPAPVSKAGGDVDGRGSGGRRRGTAIEDGNDANSPHRYDLSDETILPWIAGSQQRKCTLCLEPMKDPSATTCGHVFCWTCVTEWLREQPMCPLCRQAALVQHVLPLRG